MSKLFTYLFHSFTNSPEGFSARKLSAFLAIIVSVIVTFKLGSESNVVELTLVWLGYSLLCLGIITIQQIIDFKAGRTTSTTTSTLTKTEEVK